MHIICPNDVATRTRIDLQAQMGKMIVGRDIKGVVYRDSEVLHFQAFTGNIETYFGLNLIFDRVLKFPLEIR
jgi:hypothetical protein